MDSVHKNNEFNDDGDAQGLKKSEIDELKRKGKSGQLRGSEIVQLVTENSTTFDKKSEFAQAKYIDRKKKKFMRVFTLIQPTGLSLCNHFFQRNPAKILNLRCDTLSQILSHCNAQYGMRTLLFDNTSGLICAALAERMGGVGSIVAIHEKAHFNNDILRYLNYNCERQLLKPVNLKRALQPELVEKQTYWKKPIPDGSDPEKQNADYQMGLDRFNKALERLESADADFREGSFDS